MMFLQRLRPILCDSQDQIRLMLLKDVLTNKKKEKKCFNYFFE